METDLGAFGLSLNAAYMMNYNLRVTDQSPVTDEVDRVFRPLELVLRGNVSWSKDGLTAFVAVNHSGSYRDNNDNRIDAWTTVDLTLAYAADDLFNSPLLGGIRLSFTAQNIFDRDPPFVATAEGLNYDAANADALGRFLTFQITKTF